jgi:ribosomal protein S18 acetylase RimI-like enzyme
MGPAWPVTEDEALIARASPAVARAQAGWIAGIEPWRGLGYRAPALARWLARAASRDEVWVARARPRGPVQGIAVVQGGFLLGAFVALLAVRPAAAGRGVGRALMARVATRTFARRRWLYVSFDRDNQAARRFYRRQGFVRVGVLPDLIKPGSVEVLLRKGRPGE